MPQAEILGKRASTMADFTIWWQKSPVSNLSPVTNTADAVFKALANLADLADEPFVIKGANFGFKCQLWQPEQPSANYTVSTSVSYTLQ